MDRKNLLTQVGPQPETDAKKLAVMVEEAAILTNMRDSRGWKLVYGQFIKPRISVDRFLLTKNRQERDEAHGAMSELDALMKFVEGKIMNGEKAAERLEAIRKEEK